MSKILELGFDRLEITDTELVMTRSVTIPLAEIIGTDSATTPDGTSAVFSTESSGYAWKFDGPVGQGHLLPFLMEIQRVINRNRDV